MSKNNDFDYIYGNNLSEVLGQSSSDYYVAEIICINKNVNKQEVINIDCGNNDINYVNVNSMDNLGVIHTIEDTESPKSNPIG